MNKTTFMLPLLFLCSFAIAAEKGDVTAAPPEPEGMTTLFNGNDLTGWDGDPRLWSVKDGCLVGQTTKENPARGNTFIIWKDGVLKDFELRLSYKCTTTNNSGIQYRSRKLPDTKDNKWKVGGYQAEVRNEPGLAGFIYDEGGKRGRMVLVGEKAVWEDGKKNVVGKVGDIGAIKAAFKVDDFNDYVIIAKGNHITQYINGVQTVDFTDNDPKLAAREGILAFQLHAGNPMKVEFKNIRIKNYE